jgi:hypothetical protein
MIRDGIMLGGCGCQQANIGEGVDLSRYLISAGAEYVRHRGDPMATESSTAECHQAGGARWAGGPPLPCREPLDQDDIVVDSPTSETKANIAGYEQGLILRVIIGPL